MKKAIVILIVLFATSYCKGKSPEQDSGEVSVKGIDRIEQSLLKAEQTYENDPANENAKTNMIIYLLQLGTYYEDKGDHEKALNYYKRTLEAAPDNMSAHYYMGRALTALNKNEEALFELNHVVQANPSYSSNIYDLLAENYLKTDQTRKAKESLLKSIVLKPGDIDVYRKLAEVYRREGNMEESDRQESMAADLEKWGYPERGYKDKTLNEWKSVARSSKKDMEKLKLKAREMQEHPLARRRAIALYNIATYYDRSMDPEKYTDYGPSMKHWGKYLQQSKHMSDEEEYRRLIKQHQNTLKRSKNNVIETLGISKLVKTNGSCTETKNNLIEMLTALERLEAVILGETSPSEEEIKRFNDLKAGIEGLNLEHYIEEFDSIALEAQDHINKKISGQEEENLAEISAGWRPRMDGMAEELTAAGIEDLKLKLKVLCNIYKVEWPEIEGVCAK